jgi:hypothetical protein
MLPLNPTPILPANQMQQLMSILSQINPNPAVAQQFQGMPQQPPAAPMPYSQSIYGGQQQPGFNFVRIRFLL